MPEGRSTIEIRAKAEVPKVGAEPPEVASQAWLHWTDEQPPSLKALRGKVVVVEFWATWCAPCIAGIPHLNDLHDKHAKDGLVILALTDQAKKDHIEEFLKSKPMKYTVGIGSQAVDAYGVEGIPHAFVISRDGTLAWHGHTADKAFDVAIAKELERK